MATTEEVVDDAIEAELLDSPCMQRTPSPCGSCFGDAGGEQQPAVASAHPPVDLFNLFSPTSSAGREGPALKCWLFTGPVAPGVTSGPQQAQAAESELQERRRAQFVVSLQCLVLCVCLVAALCCIPPLLRSLLALLVTFEPSPLRKFSVACLAAENEGFEAAERTGGVGLATFADGNEASGCEALLHFPKVWKSRPPLGSLTFAAQAATLCAFACLRFLGLGPLLPPPATVQHYIQRLAPALSGLYLLPRMSHQPVQPPCEEWVFVRERTSTRDMVHTARSTYTPEQTLKASPYDFVIVGGGTAGSTLAGLVSRLHASPQSHESVRKMHASVESREGARILLLEAGGWPDLRETSPLRMPARTVEGQRGLMDWHLSTTRQTQACKGLNASQSFWPRGRGLGGSSWLNYMLYVRGDPRDFESFSECTGDERWRFRNVLEHYKRIETVQFPADDAFRGREGPLSVSLQRTIDPSVLAFIRSAEGLQSLSEKASRADGKERGAAGVRFYAANEDYNGERLTGPSLFQYNTLNGRRRTPLEAFLFHSKFEKEADETRQQVSPSVSVVFHARVVKVLFEEMKSNRPEICRGRGDVCPLVHRPGCPPLQAFGPMDHTLRATGLLVVDGRLCNAEKWEAEQCQVYELPIGGELILSAGAIHTPQILLHSGVGDVAELNALGLQPLVNLPGVGKNLQDHIFTPRMFLLKDQVPLEEFASYFPSSEKPPPSDAPQAGKEAPLERLEAYAAALHTKVSLEVEGREVEEEGTGDVARKEGREDVRGKPHLLIKTANARRGCQLSTLWQYLTQDAGVLTSPGVEAQVLSENFRDLKDDESPSSSSPSSCLQDPHVPDIQLHFLNGLPDVTYMTSRLNTPRWFPFFVGSPDKWGSAPDANQLHGVVLMPVLLHPRSRGSVTLRKRAGDKGNPASTPFSVNPLQPPQIDPRYLSSERDVEALVKGFAMANSITTSGPFKRLVKEELIPHCHSEVWRQILTKNPFTGDAFVGLDRVERQPNPASKSLEQEKACAGAECVLSALAEELVQRYPELAKIDPALPQFCALTVAHEKKRISDMEWARGFVRLFTFTLYHPVGTCKMGKGDPAFLAAYGKAEEGQEQCPWKCRDNELVNPFAQTASTTCAREEDKVEEEQQIKKENQTLLSWSQSAVVDGGLKLCGGLCVQNVRVVDASVMPHLPSGNTHAPAIVLAHIAFDAIAEEWNKTPS